jgi:hypothetical protein
MTLVNVMAFANSMLFVVPVLAPFYRDIGLGYGTS